ncbi:MAG TPA: DEAD/DEAH box helicase [Terriglobia bacterium]|nr:DEAD/DEAH box helicase [Terriglobia bacterium]
MLTLRPYQTSLIDAVRDQLRNGMQRVLLTSPTGSGKTCLTAYMIKNAVEKGKRCWFLNHRRELVRQSVETLEDSAGVHCGMIASGFGANGYHLAQVASIQTLFRRWQKYPLPDLIICDEAHHLVSPSWSALLKAILERKPEIKIVGLTATPARLDGRGLGDWFQVIVEGPSTATLIGQGYLAKYRMWGAALPDLTGVRTVAGDYDKKQLAASLSRTAVVGDALNEYRKHCDGKRALVFMWSIQSSIELAERFNMAGIVARHLDGETDHVVRDRTIAAFRAGEVKVISNVDLFAEGLDVPAVEAGFLMRPTQSLAMYLQQCGRILRPNENKDAALLFDHAGHAAVHGYPDDAHAWTLDGIEKKSLKRNAPIRQCPQCYATVPLSAKTCRWCNTVFVPKPREVEEVEGELEELTAEQMVAMQARRTARREQGMASTYEALLAIERQRGYRPGWARIVWRAKTNPNDRTDSESNLKRNADYYRPKGKT